MENEVAKTKDCSLDKYIDSGIDTRKNEKCQPAEQKIAIITKCAYDKGKAHMCVEYIGPSNNGVMHQLVLSAEDVISLIERKAGKAYIPPKEMY